MKQNVSPIPKGYHTATPYLVVRDTARALEFYKKAFGANELFRMPGPDGRIMHAEMVIGDSHIMLTDENPRMCAKSPETLGGTPVSLFLYVENADGFFKTATSGGASRSRGTAGYVLGQIVSGKLSVPFGQEGSGASPSEDVTSEEMGKRMKAEFAKAAV